MSKDITLSSNFFDGNIFIYFPLIFFHFTSEKIRGIDVILRPRTATVCIYL